MPNLSTSINYTDLLKLFWQKDIQYHFSDKEIAFYFYLLHTCNSNKGNTVFGISNSMLLAKFGWGRQSLKNIKTKLKEAQLIDYISGHGRGNIDQYQIIEKEKMRRNNSKQNKNKENANPLQLPYQSENFVKLWNNLLQTPKWRVKPLQILQANLNKLKMYDEPFAIQLIEQTLLGNWQGLIFRDTDNQYKKWKAELNQMNETKQNRRDQIMRLAAQAAAACNS